MVLTLRSLSPSERWMDDGYHYTMATCRSVGMILLDVSRVLAAGRMSPILGRRAFLEEEELLLGAIFGTESPARTLLVDQIIRGGPIHLDDILKDSACEADLE